MMRLLCILMLLFAAAAARPVQTALGPVQIHVPEGTPPATRVLLAELTRDLALVLVDRYGPVPQAPFQLWWTRNKSAIADVVGHSIPGWIQALASENPARIVLSGDTGPAGADAMAQTLLHELAHVYLHRLYPREHGGPLPGWLHEGLAVQTSGGWTREMHQVLVTTRFFGRWYSLAEMDRIYHTSPALSQQIYAQSVAAVQIMQEVYGATIMQEIFNYLRAGADFATAFHRGTGVDLAAFERIYRNQLEKRYNLVMLLGDPSAPFIVLPFLLIVAYLIKRLRAHAIRERWKEEEELERFEDEPRAQA